MKIPHLETNFFLFVHCQQSKSEVCKIQKDTIEKNYNTEWKGQRFDENSDVCLLTNEDSVKVCPRSKRGTGECCYSMCMPCYLELSTSQNQRIKRTSLSKPEVTKTTESNNVCSHSLGQLTDETNPDWCDIHPKHGLFTKRWMRHVKGCVNCKKMYVRVKKKNATNVTLPKLTDKVSSMWDLLDAGEYNQNDWL